MNKIFTAAVSFSFCNVDAFRVMHVFAKLFSLQTATKPKKEKAEKNEIRRIMRRTTNTDELVEGFVVIQKLLFYTFFANFLLQKSEICLEKALHYTIPETAHFIASMKDFRHANY